MLDSNLTPEQEEFRRIARRLALDEFVAEEADPDYRAFILRRARRLSELGLTGIAFPDHDGGQNGSLLDAVLVLYEIAKVSPRSGDVVQAYNFGGIRQLQVAGSPEMKERWLYPALRGEILVSLAMSEPDAGSSLKEVRTKATIDGGDVVLNGTKIFATHGVDADVVITWCQFADGLGAVLVPADTPGFVRGRVEHFMSGERYCEMEYRECRIPRSHILIEHDAVRSLMPIFNVERLGNATRALALATRAYELAIEHASSRSVGGRPLSEKQGIAWMIADMTMRLRAAHLLLERAIAHDPPSDEDTAIAKCYANETAFFVADRSLQIHGGSGYSAEHPVEYIFRRVRGWMIAGGTTEILRDRIARAVFRQYERGATRG